MPGIIRCLLVNSIKWNYSHAKHGAPVLFLFALIIVLFSAEDVAALTFEWESRGVKNGIENYYAIKPGRKYRSVRGVMTVDMPAERIASKIIAAEESAEWMYRVKEVDVIKLSEKGAPIFRFEWKVPWPFANREVILNQTVTRDEGAQRVTILYDDYRGDTPKSKKVARMHDFSCTWVVETLPGGSTRVEVVIDPSLSGKAPSWFVNLFFKDAAQKSMKKLRKILEEHRV